MLCFTKRSLQWVAVEAGLIERRRSEQKQKGISAWLSAAVRGLLAWLSATVSDRGVKDGLEARRRGLPKAVTVSYNCGGKAVGVRTGGAGGREEGDTHLPPLGSTPRRP